MQSMMSFLVIRTKWCQSSVFISPAIQIILRMTDKEYVPGGFRFEVI